MAEAIEGAFPGVALLAVVVQANAAVRANVDRRIAQVDTAFAARTDALVETRQG